MADDLMAEYKRRMGLAEAPALEVVGGTDAEGAQQDDEKKPTRFRLPCVEMRPLQALWCYAKYSQLINVLADGRNPTFVALWFSQMLVILRGRELQSIVAGMMTETQWFIEQYDEKKNGTPPKGMPVVLSFEFIFENILERVAGLMKGGVKPV
jgi:hypothetical protein